MGKKKENFRYYYTETGSLQMMYKRNLSIGHSPPAIHTTFTLLVKLNVVNLSVDLQPTQNCMYQFKHKLREHCNIKWSQS